MAENDFGISLEDALRELKQSCETASNFMHAEFIGDWETGEAYYAGKCDLPREEGRSSVVKTESRDIIRALMPNIMRILLHSRKPVEYIPNNIRTSRFAEQQSLWVNQLFTSCGGYMALYSAILESMKLKSGPIKVLWEENPHPEHISATGLTAAQVALFQDDPDIVVDEVTVHENAVPVPDRDATLQSPTGGQNETLYDLKGTRYWQNGRIVFEAFPIYEFFVPREASDLQGLHGHRRSVSVSEAIEMGLEYDDWRSLDNNDPKFNEGTQVERHRRGYTPNKEKLTERDLMNHEFLLTEAYCSYDMDGDGVAEKYVFYLGGTSYQYIYHEQIEDFCIEIVNVDPQPFTVVGRSVIDVTKQSTDNETSVLRAIVDNAHIANNPRPAGDPTRVNFNDLMNNAIGAPIRTKGTPDIKHVDTPFTGGGLLPLLQWLESDAQMRVGVTKAAAGLDPDAMQSTDKNAVLNTIQLSQGQVELMVRHIIETALIPLFSRALRLATRHMNRRQMLLYKGAVVPIDTAYFDPTLAAKPNVGLGTAAPEAKFNALTFVLNEQKGYLKQFGLDNPFVSLDQVYNTIEDMLEIGGIHNVGRYFKYIGPEMERVIAQQIIEQQQAAKEEQLKLMPLDPGRAVVMQEQLRNQLRSLEAYLKSAGEAADRQLRAIQGAEELDFKRDDQVQDRIIRLVEIGNEEANERIRREQEQSTAEAPEPAASAGSGAAS